MMPAARQPRSRAAAPAGAAPPFARISADEMHPDWHPLYRWVDIYLDGELLELVVQADTSTGAVVQVETDASGNMIHDGDRLRMRVRRGEVRLVLAEGAPDMAGWSRASE